MSKAPIAIERRSESLSRDRIIEASITLLDQGGESGLTFRALSERLATGPGAIYWHVAGKSELLIAACDAIVARTMDALPHGATPQDNIRALALGLFDAIDAHAWIGSALTHAPWQSSMMRILERLGQDVRALGVPESELRVSASALISYIFGVAGLHAANMQFARAQGIDRLDFLDSVASAWSQLDTKAYPFIHSIIEQMRVHDDRKDFSAGIDIIVSGIIAALPPP
ncbi:MAG: TetR family transcriptional regulator [Candidatus Eremiobacteraeota bacterium]|nr:TetR family transcriptional regulator [Candidatus Eremiobacteraeota bacterium]